MTRFFSRVLDQLHTDARHRPPFALSCLPLYGARWRFKDDEFTAQLEVDNIPLPIQLIAVISEVDFTTRTPTLAVLPLYANDATRCKNILYDGKSFDPEVDEGRFHILNRSDLR